MAGPDSALYSVAELLATQQLRDVVLLTPASGSLERRLVGASVQEGAVEGFVRQDELVMSTALGLESPRDMASFVRDVAAAGAAALALALRPGRGPIAGSVIRVAGELGLPLLQLPWRLPFSQITTLIVERAVEVRTSQMLASDAARATFDRLASSGGSVQEVAAFAEQVLRRPVEVTNARGARLYAPAIDASWSDAGWLSVPVVSGTTVVATLRIAGDAALDALQADLVRRATIALGALLGRDAGPEDERSRAVAELFAGLLDARAGFRDELARLARAAGLDARGPVVAVHVRVGGPDPDSARAVADAAARTVRRALSSRRLVGVQAWQGDSGSVIVQLRSAGLARAATELLLGDVTAAVQEHAPAARFVAGIGRAGAVGDLPRRMREARVAARVAWSSARRAGRLHYDDLDVDELLREAVSGAPDALDALQEVCLDGILAYERDRGLPLTSTLAALFGENGNVSSTARRLAINRQSLLYRLERAQSLAGLSLSRATDRLALEIAVHAWNARRVRDVGGSALASQRP